MINTSCFLTLCWLGFLICVGALQAGIYGYSIFAGAAIGGGVGVGSIFLWCYCIDFFEKIKKLKRK